MYICVVTVHTRTCTVAVLPMWLWVTVYVAFNLLQLYSPDCCPAYRCGKVLPAASVSAARHPLCSEAHPDALLYHTYDRTQGRTCVRGNLGREGGEGERMEGGRREGGREGRGGRKGREGGEGGRGGREGRGSKIQFF